MGCFLACFGVSKKHRKLKKHSKKALTKDITIGSYESLESSVPLSLGLTDIPIGSDFEFRDKPKSELKSKIRKKVSFNLNVQVYEPISTEYHLLKSETEEEYNNGVEETVKKAARGSNFEGCNYRYQNWLDSWDEDDDIAHEDDDHDGEYSDEDSDNGSSVDEDYFSSFKSHCDSDNGMSRSVVSDGNTRKFEYSVLSPIENLTQWKAAKARTKEPRKSPRRKENIAVEKEPPLHIRTISNANESMVGVESNVYKSMPRAENISVDASLCNWLTGPCLNHFMSPDNNESKTGVGTILGTKSSVDKSNFLRHTEDSPNLDITDWET